MVDLPIYIFQVCPWPHCSAVAIVWVWVWGILRTYLTRFEDEGPGGVLSYNQSSHQRLPITLLWKDCFLLGIVQAVLGLCDTTSEQRLDLTQIIWVCSDIWVFSVLHNRHLSDIWVIFQKYQYEARKDCKGLFLQSLALKIIIITKNIWKLDK